MAIVQPEYGPDYSRILLSGIQAYRGIKDAQRGDAADERQRKADEYAAIAMDDPEAMKKLYAYDPQRAMQMQQYGASQQRAGQQQKEMDIERFKKERAETSAILRGQPIGTQIRILDDRINMLQQRGSDPSHTINLRDKLASNDPEQIRESNMIIDEAYTTGQIQGFLPRDKKTDAIEKSIKRADLVKKYKDVGLSPKQIANVLKSTNKMDPETTALIGELEATKQKIGTIPPDKKFESEQSLRKEYSKETGDFVKVQESYRRIKSVDKTAAGDLALIFNYMKMLDPGSVVRESEYATAENAAGVPDRVRKQWNKMIDGDKLAPKQRADFKKQSSNLYGAAKKREGNVRKKLQKIANQYNLDPNNIFFAEPDQETAQTAQPQTVQPLSPDELKELE